MPHEIDASEWLNTPTPLSLAQLRGRVVVVVVFQMLCPGCVSLALPQARRLQAAFAPDELAVLGLHSVFEHHRVMTPDALRVFASEYRLTFPIAIDRASGDSASPATLSNWRLHGTPTTMVFNRDGELVLRHFGHLEDMALGAVVGRCAAREACGVRAVPTAGVGDPEGDACDAGACVRPPDGD